MAAVLIPLVTAAKLDVGLVLGMFVGDDVARRWVPSWLRAAAGKSKGPATTPASATRRDHGDEPMAVFRVLNWLSSVIFLVSSVQLVLAARQGVPMLTFPFRVFLASSSLLYLLAFFGVSLIYKWIEEEMDFQQDLLLSETRQALGGSASTAPGKDRESKAGAVIRRRLAAASDTPDAPPARSAGSDDGSSSSPPSSSSSSSSAFATHTSSSCDSLWGLLIHIVCGIVAVVVASVPLTGLHHLLSQYGPALLAHASAVVRPALPLTFTSWARLEEALTATPHLPWVACLVFVVVLILRERRARQSVERELHELRRTSDPHFQARVQERLKTYPNRIANGWYKLCDSDDVARGQVKHFDVLGLSLAVFRGQDSGAVSVLDAYCPHLGANLAIGGRVCGDELECPFHKWRVGLDGCVSHIPYADNIPSSAKTRKWPTREWYNMVLVFYDHDEAERARRGECATRVMSAEDVAVARGMPIEDARSHGDAAACFVAPYEPLEFPAVSSGAFPFRGRHNAHDVYMHLQEFAENSADFRHFDAIHSQMTLPWTSVPIPGVNIKHDPRWELGSDTEGRHVAHFRDHAILRVLGRDLPSTGADADITFIGPGGLAVFTFDLRGLGGIVMFQTHTPVSVMRLRTEFRWYASSAIPSLLLNYIVGSWISQWQNDLDIWENKVFLRKPVLARGDGPMMRMRAWYQQFYATGNARVALRADAEDRPAESAETTINAASTTEISAASAASATRRSALDW